MKKRWMSLLLALVLSLTLLPTAALADNTPVTGVYTAVNTDGTPSGTYYEGFRPNESGPWGYWNIPYTSGSETILYYYDAKNTSLSSDQTGVSVELIKEHLWKLTITKSAGPGNFTADFQLAENNGFPISFQDNCKPELGLYYKPLRGVNDDQPHVDTDDSYSNAPIQLSPYVDRKDIATYFYDGETYTPVDVTFGPSLSVVPVKVREQTGWYIFAAYDFCNGTMFYTHEGITYYLNVSTHLPDYGFYVKGTVAASEKAYRMYTIAEENTSTDERYSKYRFSKTLTFMPSDPQENLGLGPNSGIEVRVTCQQRQYLPNGSEVDSIDYNDFAYSWEAGDNTIELTLYTNDSDVMCFLNGTENGDWKFGTYVNVLAPIRQTGIFALIMLRTNDLGKPSAAKFLPKHLFKEAAEKAFGITLSAGDYAADVTFDAAQTAAMADVTNAAMEVTNAALSNEQTAAITADNADATIQGAVDLSLTFNGDAQHKLSGTATISYPCKLDLDDGEMVKVCYVADDGTTELIDAAYDAETGCVTFTTNHFSTFAVVTLPAPASTPSTSGGSSAPTYSVTAPKADNGTVKVSPRYAEQGDTVTVTVTPDVGYLLDSLTVLDKNGKAIELTDLGNGKYSFKVPKGKVTVEATFVEDTAQLPSFADVPADAYFANAVNWAAENGITGGVDDTHFGPDRPCTRAQLAAFLYRAAGCPVVNYAMSFTDVGDDYYTEAVRWAASLGIVGGYGNGLFGTNDTITREQFVTILYRFVVAIGYDVSVGEDTNILSYNDAFDVSEYAVEAFRWATGAGIVQGADGNLMPKASCIRAQIVTMLYRLLGTN